MGVRDEVEGGGMKEEEKTSNRGTELEMPGKGLNTYQKGVRWGWVELSKRENETKWDRKRSRSLRVLDDHE